MSFVNPNIYTVIPHPTPYKCEFYLKLILSVNTKYTARRQLLIMHVDKCDIGER